jgi:hypothetical protein
VSVTAVIATPAPSPPPPILDVPHELLTVEVGTRPSGRADLFVAGPCSTQQAWQTGLAYLKLHSNRSGPCWLGGSSAPPLKPLLAMLDADASIGAVAAAGGLLVRREALDALGGAITPASLLAAGWRTLQAPQTSAAPMLEWITRPFTRADMAPVPAGWQVGPPDFIGVGCGKAGSSWWHDLLSQHPDVVANRLRSKELHFLCHFDYRGPSEGDIETYRAAFARPPGRLCGEWSGNLLQHPLALSYMAEAAPGAKLIALVRNPIDRSVSALNQFLRHRAPFMGISGAPRRVLETFSLFPEAMLASRLARPLREILRTYPREQLLVLQYEACRADPAAALRKTWDFLGLRPTPIPAGIRQAVNRQPYVVDRPDASQRARLAAWFADDVDAVMAMFPELDRQLWVDFA